MRGLILMAVLFSAVPAWATTYYISPSGSNVNPGTSIGNPWLTFTFALSNMVCGDTLVLLNGTYGDGTSTGKPFVNGRACSVGNELRIQALNQRQAKIVDTGLGYGVRVENSSYIIIDGIYARSADNNAATSNVGHPFFINYTGSPQTAAASTTHHITVRNSISVNPNRYVNTHCISVQYARDVLVEDHECYIFHRHNLLAFASQRVVGRRMYANPRGGKIADGFGLDQGPLGSGAAVMAMYPCQDCILENSISDATTNATYLAEMNSSFFGDVPMSGSKVLGSISYNTDYGNGIYPNARTSADLNHTPINIVLRDNAIINYRANSSMIRVWDPVNVTIDHNTMLGDGVAASKGISIEDTANGATLAQQSVTITNTLVHDAGSTGFSVTGLPASWSGDRLYSYSNGTAFTPSLPSNWTNTSTADPQLGTCKVWIPATSPLKGAGSGGSDIGANILYRTVDGVRTEIPLWDLTTGAFPHGAFTADGVNNVAGESLFDFHTRINVNTGGCSFPSGYGGSGGTGGTVTIGTEASSGDCTTTCNWNHTFSASQDRALVCFAMRDDGSNVGSVASVTIGGSPATFVKRAVSVPAWRAVEMWQMATPPSGVQAIAVTTTGAVSGSVGKSMEFDTTSALNTAVAMVSPPNTPSSTIAVTAPTNTNELVVDCVASSNAVSLTAGADQTAYTNVTHTTKSILLGASTQPGTFGGVMDNVLGTGVYWAQVAVSLVASPSDPPGIATLTVDRFQWLKAYGVGDSAPIAGAENATIDIIQDGIAIVRSEITAGIDTTSPFGVALYCQKNGGGYTQVFNSVGAHGIRLYGGGVHPDLDPSLTSTTQRFTPAGSFDIGAIIRDDASVFIVPSMVAGNKTEVAHVIVNTNAAGATVQCQHRKDDGSTLINTVTPTFRSIKPQAAVGF